MSYNKTLILGLSFFLFYSYQSCGQENINKQLETAGARDSEKVNSLLNSKSDPNTKNEWQDKALRRAVDRGDAKTVEALISAGADLLARDPAGQTALELAIANKNSEIAELLSKAIIEKYPVEAKIIEQELRREIFQDPQTWSAWLGKHVTEPLGLKGYPYGAVLKKSLDKLSPTEWADWLKKNSLVFKKIVSAVNMQVYSDVMQTCKRVYESTGYPTLEGTKKDFAEFVKEAPTVIPLIAIGAGIMYWLECRRQAAHAFGPWVPLLGPVAAAVGIGPRVRH
jgi:hypothetical protein